MKKVALGILVALVAASPALAAKKAKAPATVAELNDNGYRWVRDSLPIYLPGWMMPMYMASQDTSKKKK